MNAKASASVRLFPPVPHSSHSFADDGIASSAARRRFLARAISALVRPPRHGRVASIAVVLALSVVFGGSYVLMKAAVSMQGVYLIPIILAVSWLGLGWGVFISLFTTALRMIGDFATTVLDPNYYFAGADLSRVVSNRISGIILNLVVVVVIHELIVLSRQLEERVQVRTAALRQAVAARERLQHSLFEAGMRERGAIGRDLHDGLGQHLTATAMAARILSTRLADRGEALAADARQLESLVKTGIDQTRQIARGLLLESVPPAELCSELEELAVTAGQHHGVQCEVAAEGPVDRLDINVASHLFYIAREALRNALRHGAASRVVIQLAVRRAWVELSVIDNGRGLVADAPRDSGMGLHIMNQRAEFMGGSLRIHPPPGGGTRVDCRVPLGGEGGVA